MILTLKSTWNFTTATAVQHYLNNNCLEIIIIIIIIIILLLLLLLLFCYFEVKWFRLALKIVACIPSYGGKWPTSHHDIMMISVIWTLFRYLVMCFHAGFLNNLKNTLRMERYLEIDLMLWYLQSTLDNSNLQGKSKKVWFIRRSKQIARSKGKTGFYFTMTFFLSHLIVEMWNENWKILPDCKK